MRVFGLLHITLTKGKLQVPVMQDVEGNSLRGNAAYYLSETGRLVYSTGADV